MKKTKWKHPLYNTWRWMRDRCENPNDTSYSRYGAKGIKVDPSWYDFHQFAVDMGPKPTPKHTIDRIDNRKGYSKVNCRWATRAEQVANRRLAYECYNGHRRTKENTILYGRAGKRKRTCAVCLTKTTKRNMPKKLERMRKEWAKNKDKINARRRALYAISNGGAR